MPLTSLRWVGEHPEREYLSPGGVAKYVGVTRRTVYTWIKEGRLTAVRTGPKLWAVSMTELDKFLQPKKAAKPAAPAAPAAARSLPKANLSDKSKRRK
jgi:excisionase family DNA binding protein